MRRPLRRSTAIDRERDEQSAGGSHWYHRGPAERATHRGHLADTKRVSAADAADVSGGDSLSGRDVLALSLSSVQRHSAGDGARGKYRVLRWRSRQLHLSAVLSGFNVIAR